VHDEDALIDAKQRIGYLPAHSDYRLQESACGGGDWAFLLLCRRQAL